jgi:predicted phosphodiesterase
MEERIDTGIMLVHGTPRRPEDFEYFHFLSEFDKMKEINYLKRQRVNVCFVGHSHMTSIFSENEKERIAFGEGEVKLSPNKSYIVSCGSTAIPRDGDGPSWVEFNTTTRVVKFRRL